MRATRTAIVSVGLIVFSWAPLSAHTLISPLTVDVDRDGAFDFSAIFKVLNGPERIASYSAEGDDNVDGLGWVADGECIAELPEGHETLVELTGELIDATRPGSAHITFVTCGVTGPVQILEADVEILPHRSRTIFWIESDAVMAATVGVGATVEIVPPEIALAKKHVAVDALGGNVFWSGAEHVFGFVQRAGYFGQDPETVFGTKGTPGGLAVDIQARSLRLTDPSDCIPCGSVQSYAIGSNDGEFLLTDLNNPGVLAVSHPLNAMCWDDTDLEFDPRILCTDLDGQGMETILTGDTARGIAIDPIFGKIYWTEFDDSAIHRVNMDGSNVETFTPAGALEPRSLVIDPTMRKLYWSDFDRGGIWRSNLEGGNVELVLDGLFQPRGIDLDHGQSDFDLRFVGNDLSWSAVPGAARFDIVRGSLATLLGSAGAFELSTELCAGMQLAATSIDSGLDPTSGEAFWWLVRGVTMTGAGSYDRSAISQAGARDAGIAASGVDCPVPE